MQTVKRTSLFAVSSIVAFFAFLAAGVVSSNGQTALAQSPALIAHSIVDRHESGNKKLRLTVEVSLVDGRIPFERELRALTEHLFGLEEPFKRKFVTYYLPGMVHGEGAFATGQYFIEEVNGQDKPKLEVFLRPYMLSDYPEYAKFAQ